MSGIVSNTTGGAATFATLTGDPMDNTELATKFNEKLAVNKILRAYQAADAVYNNTSTLANTSLSVTVEAGGIYAIKLVVHQDSIARALKLAFGGTATITNFIGQWLNFEISNVSSGTTERATSATTEPTNALDGISAYIELDGSVEINAAGTFILQAAQSNSNASDTTLLRGSSLILTKLN